ncbi:hypothetical protein ATANTOWER_024301, partial [Ataeniobius toweri]|nr:hypothetical protein [Ataeniobius toweri]
VASPSGENHSRMSFGPTCLTPAGEFSAWLTLVPTPTNLSSLSRFGHALTWTGSTRCLEVTGGSHRSTWIKSFQQKEQTESFW